MANHYDLNFGVGDVTRQCGVDRETVKKWCYLFADYLSKPAKPEKGMARSFCIDDLRAFQVIAAYWEDQPDMENIRYCLNSYSPDDWLLGDIADEVTPIFRELPDDIDETWRPYGTLVGGMAEIRDNFMLAESYKRAADALLEKASADEEIWEVSYPIIFLYRHATELYLKSVVGQGGHDLQNLLAAFKVVMDKEFNQKTPDWFDNLIMAFHDFDPGSDSFRYAGELSYPIPAEAWFDGSRTRKQMANFAEGIGNVRAKRSIRS